MIILVISGPSGSGKSTLSRKITQTEFNFKLSTSITTRQIRQGEQNNIDYVFINKDQFKKMIENDELLEYTEIYGNFYGTSKKTILDSINLNNLLFDVNHLGNKNIRQYYQEHLQNLSHQITFISIYIMPPSISELKTRLINRGDALESIERRISQAEHEMSFAHEYQHKIINQDIEEAYQQILSIIKSANI